MDKAIKNNLIMLIYFGGIAFLYWFIGYWCIIAVLLFLLVRSIIMLYKFRRQIVNAFNYIALTLKIKNFRPNLNDDLGLRDIIGLEKYKEEEDVDPKPMEKPNKD